MYRLDLELPNLLPDFLEFARIDTTSEISAAKNEPPFGIPTSSGQLRLARLLKTKLQKIQGLEDISLDESHSILTATLPGNASQLKIPTIAFFAHLDTSADAKPDEGGHHPKVIFNFDGKDILLNPDQMLKVDEFPEIRQYIGDDIVVTDGKSLLGADDKAGVASLISAAEYLCNNPKILHGTVKFVFVPDEEIGLLGAKYFAMNDLDRFGADFGYTLDACAVGEYMVETWHAASASVTIKGKPAHPMSAKAAKMVNSITLANAFISNLPQNEVPEKTEKQEGCMWVSSFNGTVKETTLSINIRYFDKSTLEDRKEFLRDLIKNINGASIKIEDQYSNPLGELQKKWNFVELALTAMKRLEIKSHRIPMRGGYDGCALSEKGLPTANLFTGAHNFHSVFEYLPVKSLHLACATVIEIIKVVYECHSK